LNGANGYRPSFEMPSSWVNPSGDTILFFQNRQWNFAASDGKVDLLSFNLTTKQVVWKMDDIELSGNSNVLPPVVYEGKVYFMGQIGLYCLNALTGQKIWEKTFPSDNLLVTNIIIQENKLFFKPSNDQYLYAIDPNTGNEIYKIAKTGFANVALEYHKGIIYYTAGDGKLYAIRAADGNIIWREKSPNYFVGKTKGVASMTDRLTIDTERNVLYVDDSYYYMCIKLPE
jgi:outer membrane protein assembly factor BamB